ncbi:hypothetical protein EFY79_02200 [Hanamia caeni]|jgi:hypothetical protein|uniref:Uncharacterized protein n=1 Tax=Hanamia caeni TaxID=2294116 RepID=A0A3M9NQR4_9BACT|nr:DUF6580 family putative transport protein [Hanamia caeni]RNI40129.1 hypothetical protein EFY79_02200 [Hanamia caeni]
MKNSKQLAISFIILIIVASLYRIMPGRPYGFAPMIAMAIFGGAVIKDKKFAFLFPLLAMFISDGLYQLLYINGVGNITGFYDGQLTNYILFGGLTVFGFFIKNFNVKKIAIASFVAPTVYFLISNFLVWASASPLAGYARPKTFSGLLMCYSDGLPFYPWSVAATFIFSALFFGSYYFMITRQAKARVIAK